MSLSLCPLPSSLNFSLHWQLSEWARRRRLFAEDHHAATPSNPRQTSTHICCNLPSKGAHYLDKHSGLSLLSIFKSLRQVNGDGRGVVQLPCSKPQTQLKLKLDPKPQNTTTTPQDSTSHPQGGGGILDHGPWGGRGGGGGAPDRIYLNKYRHVYIHMYMHAHKHMYLYVQAYTYMYIQKDVIKLRISVSILLECVML